MLRAGRAGSGNKERTEDGTHRLGSLSGGNYPGRLPLPASIVYLPVYCTFRRTREGARTTSWQSGRTCAALDGDAPLGTASLVGHDMSTHRELSPWLASVYVTPAARGRGVASALVRHAVGQAAAMGVTRLFLFTPDAQGLYEKLGWRALATEHFQGHPVTIMTIDLVFESASLPNPQSL
ncbi:MAG: GNAT family N-acetyltransferase [Thermomicrobia bacterium]|nr:GNAT family N-acetyltransferase [Thermomicrobia bacterium]